MANPIRELIYDDVLTTLATILVSNGYSTDVRSVIGEGKSILNVDEYPAVIVFDLGDVKRWIIRNVVENRMTLKLRCLTHDYVEASKIETLLRLVADVEKAMQVDETRGGYAVSTDFVQGTPSLNEDEAPFGTNELAVEILYRTVRTDPTQLGVI